jgi:hypothetical protein
LFCGEYSVRVPHRGHGTILTDCKT